MLKQVFTDFDQYITTAQGLHLTDELQFDHFHIPSITEDYVFELNIQKGSQCFESAACIVIQAVTPKCDPFAQQIWLVYGEERPRYDFRNGYIMLC